MRRITVSCLTLALILLGLTLPAAAQNVTIQLTPQGLPIQIPAQGGSFNYTIAATNNGATPQRAVVWCMITLPDSSIFGPVLGPVRITLSPGQTIERQRTQVIPAGFPAGNYSFNAHIGVYPDILWDSDSFAFEKLSAQPGGSELWVARYNGPVNDYDWAQDITVDRRGNVYITGHSDQGATGYDYITIKYDGWGNQLWAATFDCTGLMGHDDRPGCIAVDDVGNVFVTGNCAMDFGSPGGDWATIKYDTWGHPIWVALYGESSTLEVATSIALDREGNSYVTGCNEEGYVTIKYAPNGTQLWRVNYTYLGYGGVACELTLDDSGNVYVTGFSFGEGYRPDFATVKYDRDGQQIWAARYVAGDSLAAWATNMSLDDRGNSYVTGYSGNFQNDADFLTVSHDRDGNLRWAAQYDNPTHNADLAFAIAADHAGNAYVTGWSTLNTYDNNYTTIKYDSLGNRVWVASYDGPTHGFDRAWDIALDASGNVFVTGESEDGLYNGDYATIEYDPRGRQVWVTRYDGPATPNRSDCSQGITLDDWGSVYVVGGSRGNSTDYDIATVKYSGGNPAAAGQGWLPVEATVFGQPLPQECRLEGNYPNPFNASTAISYELRAASYVNLAVYDVSGRLVETLVDGWRSAGEHELTFDASDLPSGIYFAIFEAGDYAGVHKMVLVK